MFETIRADIARKKQWYRRDQESPFSILNVLFSPGTIALLMFRYGHWAHQFKNPALKDSLQATLLARGALCDFPHTDSDFGAGQDR